MKEITDLHTVFEIGMKRRIPYFSYATTGMILNLGAGNQDIPGALKYQLPHWDARRDGIPHGNETVDTIHAHHFLEHLESEVIIELLKECQRVLKLDGRMLITVPYYKSDMAFQDVNHKSFWDIDTFKELLENSYYDTCPSGAPCPWQLKVMHSIIMGINSRNLALIFQLKKERGDEQQ